MEEKHAAVKKRKDHLRPGREPVGRKPVNSWPKLNSGCWLTLSDGRDLSPLKMFSTEQVGFLSGSPWSISILWVETVADWLQSTPRCATPLNRKAASGIIPDMVHPKRTPTLVLLTCLLVRVADIHAADEIMTPTQQLSKTWDLLDKGLEDQASAQVRLVGTNALPILVLMLQVKEASNQLTNSNRAIFGFRSLGSAAKPAIPEVIRLLAHPDYAGNAVLALAGIGPDAVSPLKAALTNENSRMRIAAASSLGLLGNLSESATPTLIANLKDKDVEIAMSAMRALENILKDPTPALPILIEYVGHTNADVQLTAMEAICSYRDKAKSAAPAIIKAMQSQDENVREQARAVLPYIDMESAKRVLGPNPLVPTR